MSKKKRIRPIALGLIEHEGHVFVSQGEDSLTGEVFYRFLGGGIDFGETSQAALAREFVEEIQAELTAIEYLTCLDNIFTLNGKPKHELIQLFRAQFVDDSFYQLEETFTLIEGERIEKAFWLKCDQIFSGECRLVPESCIPYLMS
ncbi:MAG: NUDIX domain-containing protein [Cyanobacteria bacterium J06598_3]